MHYFVIAADTDEELGEIDVRDDDEILSALEDQDFITSTDDAELVSRPDGEYHVAEFGRTKLFICNRGPDGGDEDDEDEDEDEDTDEDEDEDEDDDYED